MVKTFDDAYETLKPYPSDFFMSIMLAQWALESDYGGSELATEANNFTGHKTTGWNGKVYPKVTIEDDGKGNKYEIIANFRLYDSPSEWAKHHASWLQRLPDTYAKAINAKTVEEQAQALQGTYATDIQYAKKIMGVIKANDLTRYDKKESVQMSFPKPKITDRRKQALGYPGRGVYSRRPLRNITTAVWHFTWSLHQQTGDIVMPKHEAFWRGTHGWDIGGYHFYIDLYGNIYWNYDLEICTYGAGTANPYTLHICCEGKGNYTQAQIKAREELTLWLMSRADLPNLKVMRGHKEVPGNSTTCPGYSVPQLNAFRADLNAKLKGGAVTPSPEPEVKPTDGEHYTVKHGDTLWLVATAHGLTLNQIRELNPQRKNDMLYTGDKLRVKGELQPVAQEGNDKQPTIKNPKEYPSKGTFEFNTSVNVRNSPRLDNKPVASYSKGERVNYDRILYGASYTWLSYISYDGVRRYVACGDNGQLYGKFI